MILKATYAMKSTWLTCTRSEDHAVMRNLKQADRPPPHATGVTQCDRGHIYRGASIDNMLYVKDRGRPKYLLDNIASVTLARSVVSLTNHESRAG